MDKILIAGFKHETSTFVRGITDEAAYRKRFLVTGEDVFKEFTGTSSEVGAFIDVLTKYGYEIVPTVVADATPGPIVGRQVYNLVKGKILEGIEKNPDIKGILLMLHGAMVVEDQDDGEGELLTCIREKVPGMPIFATLDMHANVTDAMVANCNALFAYDTYPHIDNYERGTEAAENMHAFLQGEIKPIMEYRPLPLIIPNLNTNVPPFSPLMDKAHELEQRPGVIAVSVLQGFRRADIPCMGMSTVVVCDGDAGLTAAVADEMADFIWERRSILKRESVPVEKAVAMAKAATDTPVVLADVADNPGGGGPCDGTQLLEEMLRQKLENAAFAIIADPETVQQAWTAGVGKEIEVELGGKTEAPELHGHPLKLKAYIKALLDGVYYNKGPMQAKQKVMMGNTAVLRIDGVEVIVTANRIQPHDLNAFYSCGIDPTTKSVLAVKSSIHFRAAFEKIAAAIIDVDLPGMSAYNPLMIEYKRVRRPIYPLDEI